jgi:hypothetical protein
MKFESAELIYQPRGIQKCNKMGIITDSTKRYDFWKKSSMNRSGVFYLKHDESVRGGVTLQIPPHTS